MSFGEKTDPNAQYLDGCWAPNPSVRRGERCRIDACGNKIAYPFGTSVVIRDEANLLDAQVYVGHKKEVSCVRFSRDGALLASGDEAGIVSIFNPVDLQLKKESTVLAGSISDIAFDHTGKRIGVCADVAKGLGNTCIMWESGTLQSDLAGSPKRISTIDIRPTSPSRLAVGGEDLTVKLHRGPPYKFSHSFEGHKNFVQCVRYSLDGSILATCGSDRKIFLLDGETGELKVELPVAHKGSIFSVSWSQDSSQLLSCSADKTVCLWDINAEKLVSTFSFGKDLPSMQMGCVFGTERAVSVSLSGDLNVLDPRTGNVGTTFVSHDSMPMNIARNATDKDEVYVGTASGNVFGYKSSGEGYKIAGSGTGKNDGLTCNKDYLWSCGHDDVLRRANINDSKVAFSKSTGLEEAPIGVSSAVADPTLSVVVSDTSISLYREEKLCDTRKFHKYGAICVGMSPDGTECTVGGTDNAGHVFSISKDKFVDDSITLNGHSGRVTAIAYSSTGKLALATSAKVITLWDSHTHQKIHDRWVYHGGAVNCIAFSPSGNHLVSGGSDYQIIVWKSDSKSAKSRMERCHVNGVTGIAWLDDETVLSCGNDGCIRKWKPKLP